MQLSYREVLRCLGARRRAAVAGPGGHAQGGQQLGDLAGAYAVGVGTAAAIARRGGKPIAVAATKGAWYRSRRLVSVDGSTMEVTDEAVNDQAFGRPGVLGCADRPRPVAQSTMPRDISGTLSLLIANRGGHAATVPRKGERRPWWGATGHRPD